MRVLAMVLEYDGSEYHGWQVQPNQPTLQGTLEEALLDILGHPVRIQSSGRTDSGTHALGQVVSLHTSSDISTYALTHALNSVLPSSIRILSVSEAPVSFNARTSAQRKEYRYLIFSGKTVPPFLKRYVHHARYSFPPPEEWRFFTSLFEGTHDFTSFSASGDSLTNRTRTISCFEVESGPPGLLLFRLVGNGFLYKMVRIILGEVSSAVLGKKSLSELTALLHRPTRDTKRLCLPARGLFLYHVEYSACDPFAGLTPVNGLFPLPLWRTHEQGTYTEK